MFCSLKCIICNGLHSSRFNKMDAVWRVAVQREWFFNTVVQMSYQLAHCLSPAWFLCQAEGFHGELEEFLQWLRRTESQLSAAKPTGGLPETAREQLQQHMVYKMSSPLVHSLDIQPLSNILLLEHLFCFIYLEFFGNDKK